MPKRCLMLRPHTQTSSPLAGQDAETPCTTSCRVPLTPRDESCPSPSLCPSCTSMQEGEMEMKLMTARVPPPPTGRQSRGTASLPGIAAIRWRVESGIPAASVTTPLVQSRLVVGG